MDVSTWMALESAMQGDQPRRAVSRNRVVRNGALPTRSGDAIGNASKRQRSPPIASSRVLRLFPPSSRTTLRQPLG